jgi:hypothetical protein
MTIKNDLSSLKVGDKCFSVTSGSVNIIEIDRGNLLIEDNKGRYYYFSGVLNAVDKHPSLFLSAKHASEYFASIKEKKTIHVKFYVHHILGENGSIYSHSTRFKEEQSVHLAKGDKYLGCTEINKTYEVEE